jgi:hypothetical protein
MTWNARVKEVKTYIFHFILFKFEIRKEFHVIYKMWEKIIPSRHLGLPRVHPSLDWEALHCGVDLALMMFSIVGGGLYL